MSDTEDKEAEGNEGAARRRRKREKLCASGAGRRHPPVRISRRLVYLYLRPTTLRVAVGPPNSDDQKLIQTLAQTLPATVARSD
jgi:hypothetical protein